jgi:apolipoprotein N-acyltransferase
VPFAEYAPIARLPGFGFRYGTPTDYVPGGAPVVFSTPVAFGVLICFEAIYPELVQPLVRQGARFLINISNDTWFEHGGGLEQHFAAAVFRAVENRRALARVTNAGVTALVGPSGRIVARLAVGVTAAEVFRVPLREDQTLYARTGDVFAWGTVLLALAAVIMTRSGTRPRT